MYFKTRIVFAQICALSFFQVPVSAEGIDIEKKPLAIHTDWELGQVVKGFIENTEVRGPYRAEGDLITRTGVWLTQESILEKRFLIKMGVGGLFFNPIPESKDRFGRGLFFGPGISQAYFAYDAGKLESPWMRLQFGIFPEKYNADAVNLGEYLFRSVAYPGILRTGNWAIVNTAAYNAHGIKADIFQMGGNCRHSFSLYLNKDYSPFFDFTPSYLFALKLGKAIELGGGASFSHYLSLKPSRLSPKNVNNAYITETLHPAIANPILISNPDEFGNKDTVKLDPIAANQKLVMPRQWYEQVTDANTGAHVLAEKLVWDTARTRKVAMDDPAADPTALTEDFRYQSSQEYYNHRAIKLMGRASLDLKALLGWEENLASQDLRLFVEAAVLGAQNYPFYYDKAQERIPVMFGVNVPTFKLLDVLSLQFEHYGSPFNQSTDKLTLGEGLPIPDAVDFAKYSLRNKTQDSWKWSVFAKRTLNPGLRLYFQVADDHFRSITFRFIDETYPMFNRFGNWYYVFKVEYGI